MSGVRSSPPESVVRLTIVGGAVTNDVGAVLKSPVDVGHVVKIVEVAKVRKGSTLQLECVPASVPVKVFLTLLVPALSSVLSSIRSWYLQTARTGTESTAMAVSLPPAVTVAVNPVTQTNELNVVVSPDAPSQMIKKSSCTHANYWSLALVRPPAL
jgi:hypothetical protein